MRGKVVELLRHHCHCHCRQCQGPTTTTPDTNTSPCERNPFRYAPPRPNAAPRNTRVVWTGTLEAGTRRCSKHGARTRGPDASRCPRRKQLCARQREADNTLLSRQAGFLLQAELLDVRRLRLADMVERVLEAGLLRGGDFGSRGLLGGHGATRATLGYSTRQSARGCDSVDGTTQSL